MSHVTCKSYKYNIFLLEENLEGLKELLKEYNLKHGLYQQDIKGS